MCTILLSNGVDVDLSSLFDSETNDDSVTVDDQCNVQCGNIDVDEVSKDLVTVNHSFEEYVVPLSVSRFQIK